MSDSDLGQMPPEQLSLGITTRVISLPAEVLTQLGGEEVAAAGSAGGFWFAKNSVSRESRNTGVIKRTAGVFGGYVAG